MIVAVIGDYGSPQYESFLLKVKLAMPEEQVSDLSRHPGHVWAKKLKARFDDISESHRVVIHPAYKESLDARRDVTYAMERGRECFIFTSDEQFRPFPEYAERI